MPLTDDELELAATTFDLKDLLPDLRAHYKAVVGKTPNGDFSDETLLHYAAESHGPHSTAQECIEAAVRHAVNRLEQRPGSGVKGKEQPNAASDDPVGLARDKARQKKQAEEKRAIEAKLEEEKAAALGRPAPGPKKPLARDFDAEPG